MEITESTKIKILGQYLGQKITPIDLSDRSSILSVALLHKLISNGLWWRDFKLILKPVIEITDEEIIECCFVGYPLAFQGNNGKSKWSVTRSDQNFASVKCKWSDFSFEFDLTGEPDILTMYHNGDLSTSLSNLYVYQHLQAEGYDLPQYILGSKTLEQSGLAIYKNKTYTDQN